MKKKSLTRVALLKKQLDICNHTRKQGGVILNFQNLQK